MAIEHHGRWRLALLGLCALATLLALREVPQSLATTTAEGPLSPVAKGYYSAWSKTSGSASLLDAVSEPTCSSSDTSNAYSGTPGALFSLSLALDPVNNGKLIREIQIAVCFKAGASTGGAFTPLARVDGADYYGTAIAPASTSECGEAVQSIELPSPVLKSDSTLLEIGAIKDLVTTRTVRICSIRATVYYEADDPPPLPTVAKSAAPSPLDATHAYWDITIDNSAANAAARSGIVITDGFADAVLESVTPAGACAQDAGTASPWTCDVAAGATTVLRVSRPLSALTDACAGGPLPNFLSSAQLSDGTALDITAGDQASPVVVPVPPDASACLPPTVRLVAHEPPLSDGYALWDIVVDQPELNALPRTVTLTPAHPVEVVGDGPCMPDSEALICEVPGASDVVLTVRRTIAETNLATGTLCNGGTMSEHLAAAALDDAAPLSITAGSASAPVVYAVQDAAACDPVAVTKALLPAQAATVTDPAEVAWQLILSNPIGGLDGAATWFRDEDATVLEGPVYSSGEGYCSGAVDSAAGTECLLPPGVSVTWTVAPRVAVERACVPRPFENTASFRFDAAGAWVALPGPTITLEGDAALCTRTIQVCLVVEDNDDGVAEPDGGEFRFGNSGNSETLVLVALEGAAACGEMVVPATPVSVFQAPAATGDRPGSNGLAGSWSGDAGGFPRAFAGASSCEKAAQTETVALAESQTSVTFCNRPVSRTKPVTIVRHYFPAVVPVVRPVLTFSAPAILPTCNATDAADGATTTWVCRVPAEWEGVVHQSSPEGWVDGQCPAGIVDLIVPDPYSRSCAYRMGALTVVASYQEHGLPLAAVDIPLATIDELSVAPNTPAAPGPTSWGPIAANPLLSHELALVIDTDRWQAVGVPELSGGGCTWGADPAAGSASASVAVSPGGACVVTFSLERLVATVIVDQLYLNAPGDPPVVSVTVDGVPDPTSWQTSGSPPHRFEKTVGVAGTGSTVEATVALENGWAPVAAFEGDCDSFSGPATPLSATPAPVSVAGVVPGDVVEVCFVSVAVGSVVLVTNETHATDGPETWHFSTTAPELGNPALTTPANPPPGGQPVTAQRTFTNVPVGAYTAAAIEGRAACLAGSAAGDFETRAAAKTGSPPSDAEASGVAGSALLPFIVLKGQATYLRFDHAGCGTVLDTGVITIEVVSDLDGDGEKDPGEAGIAGWPITVTGPDGDAALVGDAQGTAHYTVVTGGTYAVRQGTAAGWLATAPAEAAVTAGLGETVRVTFFNQPRVSVAVSVSEISLASPGGAPGEGWALTLDGCGLVRTLVTTASGSGVFAGLPPAAGCTYTVKISDRAGWATIEPSKVTSPAGPGQVAHLAFATVKIDVCLDCAPPPAVTGGEPSPSATALAVVAGANLFAWPAGPVPVDEVFGHTGGVVAVYHWDEAAGAWRKYFPGLPGYLNDLISLEPGAAYWVIASGRTSIPLPGPG